MRAGIEVVLFAVLGWATTAHVADAQQPSDLLVVGTVVSPPFVVKGSGERLDGLAVELWRDVAAHAGIEFRFEERPADELVGALQAGELDVIVGALVMTPEREKLIDFSVPFLESDLVIVVAAQNVSGEPERDIFFFLTSRHFLEVFQFVVVALFVAGGLAWWVARRKGKDRARRGVQAHPVDRIATVWIFGSFVLIALFGAALASSFLLVAGPAVHDVYTLSRGHVAVVRDSEVEPYLRRAWPTAEEYRDPTSYDDFASALRALESLEVDAVVHPRPAVNRALRRSGRIRIRPERVGRHRYAFAFADDSELREIVDRAILERNQTDSWSETLSNWGAWGGR